MGKGIEEGKGKGGGKLGLEKVEEAGEGREE